MRIREATIELHVHTNKEKENIKVSVYTRAIYVKIIINIRNLSNLSSHIVKSIITSLATKLLVEEEAERLAKD